MRVTVGTTAIPNMIVSSGTLTSFQLTTGCKTHTHLGSWVPFKITRKERPQTQQIQDPLSPLPLNFTLQPLHPLPVVKSHCDPASARRCPRGG